MTATTSAPLRLGIDFGTSNSAIAWRDAQGQARLIALEGEATAMPTAVFFNLEEHRLQFGRDAVNEYLAGTDGRLMRSLKSLLGSALMQEKTTIGNQQVSFTDIIGIYLRELAARAKRVTGRDPDEVVLGRPVHFHDDDPERDRQAQDTLAQAAREAGLGEVSFQLEPIAAAFDHERAFTQDAVVLIADIGGGTSDFTVVRLGPGRRARHSRADDILATTGVHIGGTDFDHRLSLEGVMPLLGYRHVGPKGREVPSGVFFDLATWHLIQWRYSPQALRDARELRSDYSDAALHRRLMAVLEYREGHRLAHEVEMGKIHASRTGQTAHLDLGCAERGLQADISAQALHTQLDALLQRTVACAQDCVRAAGLSAADLNGLCLTGGSSALTPFREALSAAFPGVPLLEGDLFGGVAAGLVLAP